MSERKNINNLFQEKFENHEVMPEEFVWENIEFKLKEKKKRRVIPFWWKFSGIAATLVIGLFMLNNLKSDTQIKSKNDVVIQDKSKNEITNKSENKDLKPIVADKSKLENLKNSIITNSNETTDKIDAEKNIKSNSEKVNKESTIANVVTKKENKSRESITEKNIVNTNDTNQKLEVITHQDIDNRTKIIDEIKNSSNSKNEKENNTIVDKNFSILNVGKENQQLKTNDSIAIATIEPNALEELLNGKEKQKVLEQKINRWQITSNIAPIYFSSTTEGSPLDSNLKKNEKEYSASNKSYGVGVNYAVNKKLKLRTGVNILNVDYNTNGILYYQNTSINSRISGLNPNAFGSNLIIESFSNVDSPYNRLIQKFNGSLNQKLGYIEIPVEISYKILEKKLAIDLIGGMSTLVLNRNEIFLQSDELNVKIGEANNLNSMHFSGNLGLGLKYNIWKKIEAHVEPIFKYQVNTFNNDSGNFKPYIFGIYSGISYSF